jgi:putative ABC transport system permease protein
MDGSWEIRKSNDEIREKSEMTIKTLVRRSLRFHLRSHLGVIAGVAIGGAALTGALVVGDSVRWTLTQNALSRLGPAHFAMFTGERLFQARLRERMCAAGQLGAQMTSRPQSYVCPTAYGLLLPGVVSRQDGAARANQVTIIGVEDPAWPEMAGWTRAVQSQSWFNQWRRGDSALISETLARQLHAGAGDEIIARIRKPSALGLDAALSPKNDNTISLRLKIGAVLGPDLLGDFALFGGGAAPANLFLPFGVMSRAVKLENQANLMLTGEIDSKSASRVLSQAVKSQWTLEDGQISVRSIEQPQSSTGGQFIRPFIEVSSPRIFLEDFIVAASLKPRSELLANRNDFASDSSNDMEFSANIVTNGYGVLTYLANLIQAGQRATPYSMVTAAGAPLVPSDMGDDEILVNDWLAEDLAVKPGDSLRLVYYAVDSGARLTEHTNAFRVRAIVPLKGIFADRSLMPEFPGVAQAESTRDWDTGFPLTYTIRDKDEAYWRKYRGTPKAFVTLRAGQAMWANRFGQLTAIRYEVPTNTFASTCREAVYRNLLANLNPASVGLEFEPVRERALKAASESQDFGGLFLGFSFFLVVAALLLMALLFQFGLEQRVIETATLLALGFTPRRVRKLFLREGSALASVGALIGSLGGLAYARLMIWGLNTIWNPAVGGSVLRFHASPVSLGTGLTASVAVAVAVIWLTLRKQARQPARELLSGQASRFQLPKGRIAKWIAVGSAASAVALLVWALVSGERENPEVFFSLGCLLLVAGCAGSVVLIRSLSNHRAVSTLSLASLGVRGCARRPTRSLASIALLASGVFVISAIGVFRLDSTRDAASKDSGTGGFALIGQSTMPIAKDLNTPAGQEFFGLGERDLPGVHFVPLRVRQGEEASCLNLSRAQKPRVLGVSPEMLEGRFSFSGAAKRYDLRRGWRLLESSAGPDPNVVPAIGDAASIEWALGKKLGDTVDYVDERGQTLKLLLVGAVANSLLQGNLIIAEDQFVRHFPGENGYRMFLIDAPSNAVSQVSATLSRALEDSGLELTRAPRRLDEFNAVQNSYLGTFQALGGLGLLLGSAGLGIVLLRNVNERRGELGLLAAVGFTRPRLHTLLLGEHGALLGLGLTIGIIAAAAAVFPDLIAPGKHLPVASVALTLAAVLLNGMIWTWAATRYALSGNLLSALRNE